MLTALVFVAVDFLLLVGGVVLSPVPELSPAGIFSNTASIETSPAGILNVVVELFTSASTTLPFKTLQFLKRCPAGAVSAVIVTVSPSKYVILSAIPPLIVG